MHSFYNYFCVILKITVILMCMAKWDQQKLSRDLSMTEYCAFVTLHLPAINCCYINFFNSEREKLDDSSWNFNFLHPFTKKIFNQWTKRSQKHENKQAKETFFLFWSFCRCCASTTESEIKLKSFFFISLAIILRKGNELFRSIWIVV